MATTPNGTAYTVHTDPIAGFGDCNWAVPDSKAAAANVPTFLYIHGAGGSANQFLTLGGYAPYRNWLLDNGWAIIEGTGADPTQWEGGSQAWGNQSSRDAYTAYLEHVDTQLDLGHVVLYGRSMGGLVSAWLYAMSPIKGRFSGWINGSGASTLFTGNTSTPTSTTNPPQIERSTGRYFSPKVWNAYGQTTYEGFAAAAASHAPESWPASVWDGKKILSTYSDQDTAVPWFPRGASRLREIWAGRATVDETDVWVGGTHAISDYHMPTITAFLASIAGGTVKEPTIYEVQERGLWRVAGKPYPQQFAIEEGVYML